jgi:hypothetical protein
MEPASIDSWAKKQRSDSLFSLREGENPLLKFVQVGKANRINPAAQGQILSGLRTFFDSMGWAWGNDFCGLIEDYQTTCGDPHAAREMLLEAIQFDRAVAFERSRNSITVATGGAK